MDGILLVDKPQGFTSHDVVNFIRKRFGIKKAGHAGTLDPMATGLLVLLIGNYTKRSNQFLNDDKEYDATMTIGATSDTGDAWGQVRPHDNKAKKIAQKDIEDIFAGFVGVMDQAVPSYSAKKFKGKKLYELARRGIEVKLDPKKIVIHSLRITGISLPEISFITSCSKGTYIRQLCVDMGNSLGCGAYLSRLRRIRSGNFEINEALSIEELKGMDVQSVKRRLKEL
jgi:tRNA pseudouridine55 synthase